jgi:hypothetical protein
LRERTNRSTEDETHLSWLENTVEALEDVLGLGSERVDTVEKYEAKNDRLQIRQTSQRGFRRRT